MFQNYYHDTGADQLSKKTRRRTGECCFGARYVGSWISYGLKQGIPWFLSVLINIMCSCCFKTILS